MSLWDKWEKEKMERMGVRVERKSDVEIYETRPKDDVRKQAWVVGGAILACILVVYFALLLDNMFSGRWSGLYIVRIFAERATIRQGGTQ